MKADIFLDLEGTIIDDLESCIFLENNCRKIKNFIKTLPMKLESVNIFTWGWLLRKEVNKSNMELLKNIALKLDTPIDSVVVKEDSLLHHAQLNGKAKITLPDYEIALNDTGFNKEQSFIEMFREYSLSNPCILIDDQIEYTKTINFLGGINTNNIENKFFIEDSPIFPNMSLINPKNL